MFPTDSPETAAANHTAHGEPPYNILVGIASVGGKPDGHSTGNQPETARRNNAEAKGRESIRSPAQIKGELFMESEVQEMWEVESARIWENICAPHPDAGKLEKVSTSLARAVSKIGEAEDVLALVVKEISGTTGEDRITSLLNDLEDLNVQINEMRKKFKRGEA